MGLSRASDPKPAEPAVASDAEVIDALNAIVEVSSRSGSWTCFDRLRLSKRCWNHKRVWRMNCQLGLNIPRWTQKRTSKCDPVLLQAGAVVNQGWARDFMHDLLFDGRRFRRIKVIDGANREALCIEVGIAIPSARLIRALNRLIDWYGAPGSPVWAMAQR